MSEEIKSAKMKGNYMVMNVKVGLDSLSPHDI